MYVTVTRRNTRKLKEKSIRRDAFNREKKSIRRDTFKLIKKYYFPYERRIKQNNKTVVFEKKGKKRGNNPVAQPVNLYQHIDI